MNTINTNSCITQPLVSFCIPTRNRYNILAQTINSIVNSTALPENYEIVIYDTSDDKDEMFYSQFKTERLRVHFGENKGYLNLISALNLGTGELLKLHNDYSVLYNYAINDLINIVKEYQKTKPVIFFSNGNVKNNNIISVSDADKFLETLSYFISWSTGFSTWRTDFIRLVEVNYEPMFPHTSLLLELLKCKSSFLVVDKPIFYNIDILNKGGYNLFKVFGEDFVNMVSKLVDIGLISNATFKHLKSDLLKVFFMDWYIWSVLESNSFTFIKPNVYRDLSKFYSKTAISLFLIRAYNRFFLNRFSISRIKKATKSKAVKLLKPFTTYYKSVKISKNNLIKIESVNKLLQGANVKEPKQILNPQYITIGKNFSALWNLRLECWDNFEGEKFTPSLIIGDNVILNSDVHIGCINKVIIGNNVLMASRIYISDHSHGEITSNALRLAPVKRPLVSKGPVIIEDNVWIGEGVCILPNVTIGQNSIIGANAVVTKSCPPNSVLTGIPASILKQL